jgi:deoxyribodipyrimidine photo-lyase
MKGVCALILFIHRKDLRIYDLTAFDYIHRKQEQSVHLLILDPFLLKRNRHLAHSGVNFLRHVRRLKELYAKTNQKLYIAYGEPAEIVNNLLRTTPFSEVVVGQDATPYAIVRDRELKKVIESFRILFTRLSDLTLVDIKDFQQFTGKPDPYRVYTPFFRKWQVYVDQQVPAVSSIQLAQLATQQLPEDIELSYPIPFSLEDYIPADDPEQVLHQFLDQQIVHYATSRDAYALEATSSLSKHINVGAISIRHVYTAAQHTTSSELWIRQLAWRDFYLYQSRFDPDYFQYEKKYDLSLLTDRYLEPWIRGQTGIPIIDATMTELRETGNMPNRLRMVTAMFLTKNLLCPFPLGEQYFRHMLTDYDNTLNRGGWLWSSSLGFDAAPYFRIMNPVTQSQTHDPTGSYIRKWLPELKHASDKDIHLPQAHAIVDVKNSRAHAIDVYKTILGAHRSE